VGKGGKLKNCSKKTFARKANNASRGGTEDHRNGKRNRWKIPEQGTSHDRQEKGGGGGGNLAKTPKQGGVTRGEEIQNQAARHAFIWSVVKVGDILI